MVYISYSRKDRVFVEKLVSDLNTKGISTWVDVHQIKPGEMWQERIKEGIENASMFILVLSENYLSSNWLSIELAFATSKKIIPIKISDLDVNSVPSVIGNIQWIDFVEDYSIGFDKLIELFPDEVKNPTPLQKQKEEVKGYVFISFCETDEDFVSFLREFLKSQDFAYWDFVEGDRNYDIQFFHELESTINDSEAVLSIISPDWKMSKWTTREFFYAEDIGKPVLLLRVKKSKPILPISGLPYIDFVDDKELGFEKLAKELVKRLK